MESTRSPVEIIKENSRGLRGSLEQSLKNQLTGSLFPPDKNIIKFHGIYEQDNRDRREIRAEKKLERDYSFMIRLRLPGGQMTPAQWLTADEIATAYAYPVIKITTRQTLQFHGVIKSHMKPALQWFDKFRLDSISACGDVNRNVICSPHPDQLPSHEEVYTYADDISSMLLPKTRAYYEIWLDEKKLADNEEPEPEPLYKNHYLPRKFKIGIAIPPNNDTDVFANDIGLIAIIEKEKLQGFNFAVGGGMGFTHGNAQTYPRIATMVGFIPAGQKIMKALYETVAIQRDYGNRSDRRLARFKHTLDTHGLDWFRKELSARTGFALENPRPFKFSERTDYFGWVPSFKKKWYYTIFVEGGRVCDENGLNIRTALREIAKTGLAGFRFTCNQNVIISDIEEKDKILIHDILDKYGIISHTEKASVIRKNAVTCVALPTCPLALAEAQRYLPHLITKIENILKELKLFEEGITIRMTGCPNGCGRPVLAEIGLIGLSPGRYNLHLGGDRTGSRMNIKYRENLDEAGILDSLKPLLVNYSAERDNNETFGDFVLRKGIVKPS